MWRHITRRQVIRNLGVGSIGLAVLAACGETKEEEPTTAQAAPAAQPAPAAAAPTAAPQAGSVSISYVSDHISGPRGSAMKWGLAEFAKFRPNILLRFVPQPADFIDSFAIQMAAGSQADVAMLGDGLLGTFAADGGYVQINDVIGKHPDWDVNNYYFCPDTYTANFDHNQSQGQLPPAVIEGPQFGAPFQGAVAGIVPQPHARRAGRYRVSERRLDVRGRLPGKREEGDGPRARTSGEPGRVRTSNSSGAKWPSAMGQMPCATPKIRS